MAATRWIDVAEIRMMYTLEGERCENVLHVLNNAGGWTIPTLLDLGATFVDWESATGKAQRSSGTFLDQVTVTDLTSLGSSRVTVPVVPAIAGTHDGSPAPNNVTCAIKHNTGVRGRGRQGRSFWIGMTETMYTANTIETASVTAIAAAMLALMNDVISLDPDYKMVVTHRQVDGVPLLVGNTSEILSFDIADAILDSQRTRLPGHKRNRRRAT